MEFSSLFPVPLIFRYRIPQITCYSQTPLFSLSAVLKDVASLLFDSIPSSCRSRNDASVSLRVYLRISPLSSYGPGFNPLPPSREYFILRLNCKILYVGFLLFLEREPKISALFLVIVVIPALLTSLLLTQPLLFFMNDDRAFPPPNSINFSPQYFVKI